MAEQRSRIEPRLEQAERAAFAVWQTRLCLAKATNRAWDGELGAAEAELRSIAGLATSPASLDLLARIRAQQGRLAEAQSLWTTASQLEPDNAAYRMAAAEAQRWQRLRVRPDIFRSVSAVAAITLLAFVIWSVGRHWGTLPVTQATRPQDDAVPSSTSTSLGSSPTSSGSAQPIVPPVFPEGWAPAPINVPGTVVSQEGDATVVMFEDGLFLSRSVLTPEAGRILDDLGQKIGSQSDAHVIAITGHTDNLPVPAGSRFADNTSLGLARASAVAERLRRAAGLRAGVIVVGSLGSDDPPFRNDSQVGRLRNRTVVIRITPRDGTESR